VKKIIGFVLILSLVLTAAIPAFGAGTDSKGLEQAILKVKSIVTIPEDYKDFQYSSSQYKDNKGKTVSVWDLNWNNSDYSGGISATVQDGGYLISYYKYSSDSQKEGLGTVTREAGQKTAADFLAKARPDIAKYFRLEKNTDSSASDRHYYRYKPYVGDIVVSFVEARIEVDKHTGEVMGYYLDGANEDLAKLPSADGVIGMEEAKAAWLEKINVPLSYYSDYDYSKKILTVFPAYSGTNTAGKAIDAKTGKVVTLYDGGYYFGDMGGASAEKAVAQDAAGNLSKEEIEAVENISNLITKEKAESIIRNTVPGITSSMKAVSAYFQKSYAEKDKYLWEIGFDGAYGTVDAKTGELISFYLYTEKSGKGLASLSEAKAREKAENFLKKITPEKFAQSRFYENPGFIIYRTVPADITEYRFNYYRQVNGIDFVDNGFSITVNKNSGMIIQYNCNWYDSAEFPAVDDIITEKAAFDYIDDAAEFNLMYKKVNDGDTALVYDFANDRISFLIDPFTGAKLGRDGKPYKDSSVPEYGDIGGHWAEETIKRLLENGYYLDGDKFNPNQKITQIGFLRFLYSPSQRYYDDEDFYKMLINYKIINDEEKAPKAEITRQDAAKFTVRFLGLGKAAEHPEIYVNPFKDRVSDEYKGYAAICYGLNVMRGDKYGRFNGANQVTNAEAAVIIYNALQVK